MEDTSFLPARDNPSWCTVGLSASLEHGRRFPSRAESRRQLSLLFCFEGSEQDLSSPGMIGRAPRRVPDPLPPVTSQRANAGPRCDAL